MSKSKSVVDTTKSVKSAPATSIINKSLLITSSILDAYDWYKSAPGDAADPSSWKAKATKDFRNSLFRIYTPMDPAAKRGVDFENRICRDLFMGRDAFLSKHGTLLTSEFYDKCRGGLQQEVVKYEYKIDGQMYCLYGKKDISFPVGSKEWPAGKTIDIKTTKEWKGHSKYTGRSQHPLYIAASGVESFEYLVAVGEDKEIAAEDTSENGAVLHEAKYEWIVDSVIPVEASLSRDDAFAILEGKIRTFVGYLAGVPELEKAYRTVFSK